MTEYSTEPLNLDSESQPGNDEMSEIPVSKLVPIIQDNHAGDKHILDY